MWRLVAERRSLLAARREALVRSVGAQRVQLARAVAPLAPSWHRLEHGLAVWRAVRQRPWLIAVPAAVLLWWRPRAVLRALSTLPMLWRVSQPLRRAGRGWPP